MSNRLWVVGGVLTAVLLAIGLPAVAVEKEAVFTMEKLSLLQGDMSGSSVLAMGSGSYTRTSFERDDRVKKYPELKSDRPIFGSVMFGGNRFDPNAGTRHFFAIDESGEDQPAATDTTVNRSVLEILGVALKGNTATTATRAVARKYDRLYFDADGDLDLTNDPVVKPMEDPPSRLASSGCVVFDPLKVGFDHGPGLGTRPAQIVPRLRVSGGSGAYSPSGAYVYFMPTVAWQGEISIGGQRYNALLNQSTAITGRFDRPFTGLTLTPVDASTKRARWYGDNYLGTLREVDAAFYEISATPTGDKLTVGPYRGRLGSLRIDPGGRDIDAEKLGATGILLSKERLLPLGDVAVPFAAEKSRKHRIPVGDYAPVSLSVNFGNLVVGLSQNRYCKEQPQVVATKSPVYSIRIRKGKPFVLDFSSKAAVLPISPAKDQTFKPGDTVRLSAAIVEPKLDLLLRSLEDTTQKVGERTLTINGERTIVPKYASLTPKVTVTDASGKQVAEGMMPFG